MVSRIPLLGALAAVLLMTASPAANAGEEAGGPPTLFSAAEYGMPGLALMALDAGTDPNAINSVGVTPLILAIREGHEDLVELLLKRGAAPNLYGAYGYTPLMWAVSANRMEAVKLLLKHGANPAAKAPDGRNALDLARQLKRGSYIAVLQAAMPAAPPAPAPEPGYWVWSDRNPPDSYRKQSQTVESRP